MCVSWHSLTAGLLRAFPIIHLLWWHIVADSTSRARGTHEGGRREPGLRYLRGSLRRNHGSVTAQLLQAQEVDLN